MVDEPEELRAELKQIGRLKYHRFRRIAAQLNHYRIDRLTIEERLIERGCSPELAEWIVRTASEDIRLSKQMENSETPETTGHVVLKGVNGVVLLIIVYLLTQYVQYTESLGWLVVLAPFLLVGSLIGSMTILRAVLEIRRRRSDRN